MNQKAAMYLTFQFIDIYIYDLCKSSYFSSGVDHRFLSNFTSNKLYNFLKTALTAASNEKEVMRNCAVTLVAFKL